MRQLVALLYHRESERCWQMVASNLLSLDSVIRADLYLRNSSSFHYGGGVAIRTNSNYPPGQAYALLFLAGRFIISSRKVQFNEERSPWIALYLEPSLGSCNYALPARKRRNLSKFLAQTSDSDLYLVSTYRSSEELPADPISS